MQCEEVGGGGASVAHIYQNDTSYSIFGTITRTHNPNFVINIHIWQPEIERESLRFRPLTSDSNREFFFWIISLRIKMPINENVFVTFLFMHGRA